MGNGVRKMAVKTELYVGKRVIELKPKDKKTIQTRGLNYETVEQRLREGWSFKNAISLTNKYVTKKGDIYWCKAFPEETLYIPLKVMRTIQIQKYQLEKNYALGKDIEEILNDDFEYIIEANDRTHYDLAIEDVERRKKAAKLEKERHKRLKPHLYNGTPQAVKPTANMLNLEYTALSMFMSEDEKREMRIKIFKAREEEHQCQ